MGNTVTLDKEQLREVAMDDRELMRELVAAVAEDTARQVELLKIAVEDGNAEQCKRLAHYSKGACSNVGAASATELLKTIERTAALRDFAECGIALARLTREVGLLRAEAAAMEG
ncbi:MAG TPA: Hpt domain-containing protein [Verrucomicrobiae bacterium]|nr:Hpt domain-containing protein [Verrucomicrobiae bacterium]